VGAEFDGGSACLSLLEAFGLKLAWFACDFTGWCVRMISACVWGGSTSVEFLRSPARTGG
jgi:hypothetical protein